MVSCVSSVEEEESRTERKDFQYLGLSVSKFLGWVLGSLDIIGIISVMHSLTLL